MPSISSASHIMRGPPFIPYISGKTVGQFLFDSATKHGEKICQIHSRTGQSESFNSLKQRSVRVALALSHKGITSEDVVVMCCKNSIDNLVPVLATSFLNAKIASLDPSQSVSQIKHLMKLTTPSVIFVDENSINLILCSLKGEQISPTIFIIGKSTEYLTLEDLQKPKENENNFRPNEGNQDEIAFLVFSSGTTGLPKAICHSHNSILNSVYSISYPFVILHFTTLYWISAIYAMLLLFEAGGTRIIVEEFDAESTLELIEKYKVTVMVSSANPALQLLSIKNLEHYDTSSLIFILLGGTFVSGFQLQNLRKVFKKSIVCSSYALTEAGVVAIFNAALQNDMLLTKIDSVGTFAPGVIAKIVDPETNKILGPKEKGEIRCKTPRMMLGYYKQDSSAAFDQDGYIKTGDIGYYDEDECLYVVERIKEMFKYKMFHVVPSLVEAELLKHPAVSEATVIGIPNETVGHIPAACVILKKDTYVTAKEIQKYVASSLSDGEQLRAGIKIVNYLPKTPSGKVIRKEVYDLYGHKFVN